MEDIKEPKRKAFVQRRLDHPTETLSQSVLAAGYNTTRQNATKIGSNLIREPQIVMALAKYDELFESAIVGTVRDWKDADKPRKRELALNAAMYGYDHIHGRATTKIEQQSTIVRININLTGDGDELPPQEILDQLDDDQQ